MKINRYNFGARFLFTTAFLGGLFLTSLLFAQSAGGSSLQVGAAPLWAQDIGDSVIGKPFLQAESAVLACAGGSIKSFYMSGTPLWSFEPNDRIGPFIARSVEGAAYVCDAAGVFRTVNRVGRELWRLDLKGPMSYAPVVGWDGRVFIPSGSTVFCRTASGFPLWTIDLGSPFAAAPILDHAGSFVTVLENRDFVRVSQFSTIDRVRLDRMPLMIVSLKSESVDGYVLLYGSGEAERIDFSEGAASGSRLSRGTFPSLPAPPVAAASFGDIFAATVRDGRVLLYNSQGQRLWTGDSHETAAEKGSANLDQSRTDMVFDERGIYSISTRGITGFAVDGRRRFIFKMPEAASLPAFGEEGILYICGKDNTLYTYKVDSKLRSVPRYKFYGFAPEGSYGMGDPPPSPWFNERNRFEDTIQNQMYDDIERIINSGQIGENEPAFTAYLMEMIGFFLNDPHFSRARPNVKPPRHMELIKLLGKIGSRDTIPFLYKIFDRYGEPAVKMACAEAIGVIGVDPWGETYESYNYLLAANNPNRDPNLLLAATRSIAALCRFSGPPLSGIGISLLRAFSNLSWAPNAIKAQIRAELDGLYKDGIDSVIR